jgi:hypothetical protein
MTTIYYIVNDAIVKKETEDLSKFPEDLVKNYIFSMKMVRYSKEYTVHDKDGTPVTYPIVGEYIFVLSGTTVESALVLIAEERYVPPPIHATLAICPYFRHQLVEIREGSEETQFFSALLEKERLVAVELLKVLTKQEDAQEETRPLVRDAIIKMREMSRMNNPLYQSFTVLNELVAYMGSAPYGIQRQFLSAIYYRDMPWMLVSTTIINVDRFEQQRIVRLPSAWIYGIEHSDNTEIRNMSLLLHSVTSHSMLQIFPRLRLLVIPSPYPAMAKILNDASKKYGFRIDAPYTIDIVREKAWLDIWKQWIMSCDACCFEPAKYVETSRGVNMCINCI